MDSPVYLSIDNGRLQIKIAENNKIHHVAIVDIAVVILNHSQITITHSVLRELANAGAVVVSTDKFHMPCSITLPIGINSQGAARPALQASFLHTSKSGEWWQQIVAAKILGQAFVLESCTIPGYRRLEKMAKKVTVDDKSNMEAQAAKFYWQAFFQAIDDSVRKREKRGAIDRVNSRLNYGYAIIRSMVARSFSGAGLCLNFGVGHYRRDNPFNLVEDFTELFRWVVDITVLNNLNSFENYDDVGELNRDSKQHLVTKILTTNIPMGRKRWQLIQAVDAICESYCTILKKPTRSLLLPFANKRGRPVIKNSTSRLLNFTQELDTKNGE